MSSILELPTAGAGGRGRPYDLVIVGASGFVGKLMTQHLLRTYALGAPPTHSGFRLAFSARNKERLAHAHEELAGLERDPEAAAKALANVPVLWGDVDDPDFAESVAGHAHVVAASLTPYSKHGSKLVAACCEKGTHYVDISGEMLWLRESIERHHHVADHKGIKIVHACGLGSVPADLSAYLMLRRLEEDGVKPTELKFLSGPMYSSLGGGSMQSYATLIATAKDEGKIKMMLDSHFLAAHALGDVSHHHHAGEAKHEPGADPTERAKELALVLQVSPKVFGVGFDWDVRRFTAQLWLAALDDEVVARSTALLNYPKTLRYVEAQTYSPTLFGFASAWATFFAAYMLAGLLWLTPTRWLLTRLRPPGSGPSRIIRERGHGTAFLVAKGTTRGGGTVTYTGEFNIPGGDPGYNETAKMLVEAALCLVLDENRLPQRSGVLTPAAAFGEVLMERLGQAAKMEFKM